MNIQELFKFTNGIPEWAHSIGWAIILLIILFIRHLWKTVGSKAFYQWSEKIIEKDKEDKRLLYAIRDNEIDQDHYSMLQILDKCTRKGYTNDKDIESISKIYHHYKNIGGNTDGERIMAKFDLIPYKTELKVPEYAGIDNPSEKAIKEILDFYGNIKNKIIHESDIKPIKPITTYVDKEEK